LYHDRVGAGCASPAVCNPKSPFTELTPVSAAAGSRLRRSHCSRQPLTLMPYTARSCCTKASLTSLGSHIPDTSPTTRGRLRVLTRVRHQVFQFPNAHRFAPRPSCLRPRPSPILNPRPQTLRSWPSGPATLLPFSLTPTLSPQPPPVLSLSASFASQYQRLSQLLTTSGRFLRSGFPHPTLARSDV
jgi:hypothetical protein